MQISVQIHLCPFFIHPGNELFDLFRGKQTKKETIPYPICSVVAVFKMLIRILNTLRSRIWDMVLFLFSVFWQDKGGRSQKSSTCSEDVSSRRLFSFFNEQKRKRACHFTKNKVITFRVILLRNVHHATYDMH